ncbi:MAG: ATP-grasp domain-containing protein [Candidatus Helarchaeota archaeon]|nr:ATP-grasp domain-containing protein [Candidatus Helarchaeota archaeon]
MKFGLDVVAVDYWGDQDLKNKIEDLIVVKEKEVKTELDKAELIVSAAEDAFKEFSKIDGILVGSGLDDRPDLWDKLNNLAPVFGNTPTVIKEVRNVLNLFKGAKKKKISCPFTHLVSTLTEAKRIGKDINFPLVLKPLGGAGGVNIRIAYNIDELKSKYLEISQLTKNEQIYIQEFIEGQDVSSMVLSTGKESKILSINEQLIGLKEANSPSSFTYCGNVIPLDTTEEATQNINESSTKLAQLFELQGINGIDFVLKNGTPYLMEINPRFPGTFELVENIIETNLLKLHFDACLGNLPSKNLSYHKYGAKIVAFSAGNYTLPDLADLKDIYDIPFPGTVANKGSPICTVQIFGKNKKEVMEKALKIINDINAKCSE